ncbi:O-methyltransferase [Desertihabitans brevis]|uniref:O-methyltransferase n=1 Tax=Desertihabitans brevis TaxID=2268447 RepID=A0A367YTB0_9ACTN|nr:O-methyltransferase [Desertihabitans brevis]RCK69084.1 O-methyltransferase [Desertihabitans brevis]
MGQDGTRQLLVRIDDYVADLFAPQDEALEAARRDSAEAGLPAISVSAAQGRLLQLLAGISGARRALEIGTLGGYSAIHLARGLAPGGTLLTLELEERHAEVARRNLERAGLSERVEVRVGDARTSLAALADAGVEPFDLVFIDADKDGYPDYLEASLRLSRPGTLLLADNTLRDGRVLDPTDTSTAAIREFNQRLAADPRVEAVVLPLLREKVDGIAIARVVG